MATTELEELPSILAGLLVVRGRRWPSKNDIDGGEGSVGVVTRVGGNSIQYNTRPWVLWPNGSEKLYPKRWLATAPADGWTQVNVKVNESNNSNNKNNSRSFNTKKHPKKQCVC